MNKRELRNFGLISGMIVAAIFGLLLPWLFSHSLPVWPWIVFSIMASLALLLPSLLIPIYKGWMKVGQMLGWVNTRIIMGILFYAMFLPIGLFMKLIGKDPMSRKLNRDDKSSYRIPCPPKNIEQMKEPF
jgi:hypothetical protein